jgi:hypothetical protein
LSIGGEGEVCRGKRPVQRSGRKERKKERKERNKDLTFGAAAGSIPSKEFSLSMAAGVGTPAEGVREGSDEW